MIANKKL